MGYASQLEEDDSLTDRQHQQAVIIRQQSERIKALISDLNLASKLEYGAHPLSLIRFSPAVLIRKTAVAFLNQYQDNSYPIEVEISAEAEATQIVADELLLQRVFENLTATAFATIPTAAPLPLMPVLWSSNIRLPSVMM